ncbi:carboxymuconolactone decarboxylase family protein [Vulcaniibacterium tengchongense]|uniref:AhpD family alkylhydroperoxidase n=1 Tax=Vulcaniibacterium tengchongense TaxID=1273429 RepID=A0A3N4VFL2_9GAMM|nr:carboxymuconolactone decarboxylase family protein [Vulcaniibacterium tengchongense]RPE81802.1 AhpD family alkylhydroperoxidase [Vulcaniibacterium tengchongense]
MNRIDYTKHAPEAFRHLLELSDRLHKGVLDPNLLELVFLRVSQINGCVFCLDMHAHALRKAGVDQRKLDTLPGWRESPLFDARERAALAWAEALNALDAGPLEENALEAVRAHFDEREVSELTFAVGAIRAWNVLNVGLRQPLPETPFEAAADAA